jgi:hydroxyacylglutathione hydrolase
MLDIVPVNAFRDNYIWTLRNATRAAVVDPGEARRVLDFLSREKLELAAILATHHHPDHVRGIAELPRGRSIPMYGPRHEPIPTVDHPVVEGDKVSIPELGATFSVLDIPGHTRAHVAYYGAGALFCGARREGRRCLAHSARKKPPIRSCAAASPRWSRPPTSTSARGWRIL